MVTPCMPTCAPVDCEVSDYTGQARIVESYGKRRRRKRWTADALAAEATKEVAVPEDRQKRMAAGPEEMMVIKTLKIVDKIGRRRGGGGGGGGGEAGREQQQRQQDLPRRPETQLNPRGGGYDVAGGELTIADGGVDGNVYREYDLHREGDDADGRWRCLDDTGLVVGAVVFLIAQVLAQLHPNQYWYC